MTTRDELNSLPAFAAVDWGTSRFRMWLLDHQGKVLAERRSDDGLDASRAKGFSATLESHLAAVGAPAELPVLVCGMAGSRQGWVEAPYVELPADVASVASASIAVSQTDRPVHIIPGLSQTGDNPNVMRGEETQLLGFALGKIGLCDLVVMPGTHSKWAQFFDNKVVSFSTYMTGELYSLIASQSILRHSIADAQGAVDPDHADFRRGVETSLQGNGLTGQLFGIRAAMLLENLSQEAAASRLSGLLIGAEIADGLAKSKLRKIALVASGLSQALYLKAFEMAGVVSEIVDADDAVRKGLLAVAHELHFNCEERQTA